MKPQIIWHPIFFALMPGVYLYSANLESYVLNMITGPLGLVLISTLLLWWMLTIWFHSSHRAALWLSGFLIIFFTFGLLPLGPVTRWLYSIVVIVLLIAAARHLKRSEQPHHASTSIMNTMALLLAISPAFQLASDYLTGRNNLRHLSYELPVIDQTDDQARPDIYYLIFDAHGRSDIHQQIYNYDDQAFITALKDEGFYIGERSNSNYIQTLLSLSSSMNLDYLNRLQSRPGDERRVLHHLIQNSVLIRSLNEADYQTRLISSSYGFTELNGFDYHPRPRFNIDQYSKQLINLTPLGALVQPFTVTKNDVGLQTASQHNRQVFNLDYLSDLPDQSPSPTFTFAHLLLPHPPFTFDRDGDWVNRATSFNLSDGSHFVQNDPAQRERYVTGYAAQVEYADQQILQIVRGIINRQGDRPTVIIVQGDHGPGSRLDWDSLENSYVPERAGILNAYYFSDGVYDDLYPTITPVNSWRVVFNRYFGTDYDLLPDQTYYSTWDNPYDFIDVTDQINKPDAQ